MVLTVHDKKNLANDEIKVTHCCGYKVHDCNEMMTLNSYEYILVN